MEQGILLERKSSKYVITDIIVTVDIRDFTDTFRDKQSVKDKVHHGIKLRYMLARMTIRAQSEL